MTDSSDYQALNRAMWDERVPVHVSSDYEARFVTSDVYDAVTALGETYDVVYTGLAR